MRSFVKIFIAGLVVLMIASMLVVIQASSVSAYTSHGTIFITSNADFSIGSNGVTSGSGTASAPWIIENWVIDASGDTGIYILNTTAYFIVRNCLIENGFSRGNCGIYLDTVINGRIENNKLNNNWYGIYLNSSSHDNLTANTCENNADGIYLHSSSYDNLTNNTCNKNSLAGIWIDSSSYDNLNNNTCENNQYGIWLYSSSDNNKLVNNTCENSSDFGIYMKSSSYENLTNNTCGNNPSGIRFENSFYDNLTNNTITSNCYGIYLSPSSSNIFTGNIFSNNSHNIYNAGGTSSYSSNQFNNNMANEMLTFVENTRTENVGDNVSFSVSTFNPIGTAISGCTITISPSEPSLSYDNGSSTVTGSFTPTKSGTYSLNFTVTDENSNVTKRTMLYFVGNTVSTATKYYFRGIQPTHGQIWGSDAGTLLLAVPTSTEEWYCSGEIQNSPDEIPSYPLANLSAIDTYTWYKQANVSGAYIGVQRYLTYDVADYGKRVDENLPIENVSVYTWINRNFTGLNWAMDYLRSWYWLKIELLADLGNPYWTTFPLGHSDQPSYATFTYSLTTTPIIKSVSNSDMVILSATAPVGDNENATLIIDGIGSTSIVLDNYKRPFIGYTTTINSDNTATIAAIGLTGTTTINSVAMDITPSSGYINVVIDNWENSGTYYKKWTENGSSPTITASHTIDNLKANTHYDVKVDGTVDNTCRSNVSGQITFTYNVGDSTKTFEIIESAITNVPPNKPDTLRVGGQVSPQLLTTFTPEFSIRYTDNDNANNSMVQIQVGTSAGDNSMWDNQQAENVENGATISVTYAGTALQRGVQYFWRVRVRDNENNWGEWSDNENFKLNQSPTVAVGGSTIELKLVEAGDAPVITTSTFTIMVTIGTRTENLLIYYASIEETPSIQTDGTIAPFYFDISTTNPDAILDATITFNIHKSWVVANNIIPSTLIAWRNSNGTWQTLPSRLVGEDAFYFYLEATTSGFSLFGVSGQKKTITPTEPQPSSLSQTSSSDQQIQQVIFIAAFGILIASAMLLVSTLQHKRRK
jgi:parallel beta-helix repeat protein